MTTIAPALLDAIFIGFNTRWQAAYRAVAQFYKMTADDVTSTSESEVYAWMDSIPSLRKWVGERQIKNLAARAAQVKNELFEMTLGLDVDKLSDDRIGVYQPWLQLAGVGAAKWPDRLVAEAKQAARTDRAFDGQPFYDNSHPVNMDDATKGTYCNRFDTTKNDTGGPRPLSATNYAYVRSVMLAYKQPDGKPMGIEPKFVLEVPPQLEPTARTILHADWLAVEPTAGTTAATQTNTYKNSAELLVNPYLSNEADRWYLHAVGQGIMPYFHQLREAVAPTFLGPQSDHYVKYNQFLYALKARGAASHTLPFLSATGAT